MKLKESVLMNKESFMKELPRSSRCEEGLAVSKPSHSKGIRVMT
jgi:hypothetical protein